MPGKRQHICPVCGYPGLTEAARDSAGNTSFEICPSCGTEFGYDDATASHEILRARWLKAGALWWSKAIRKPRAWDPIAQLHDAGLLDVLEAGPVRKALGHALKDLAANGDIAVRTAPRYVVDYLTKSVMESKPRRTARSAIGAGDWRPRKPIVNGAARH